MFFLTTSSCYFRNNACEGSSSFPFPKKLNNLIKCFRWCLVKKYKSCRQKSNRKIDAEFVKQLDFKDIEFLVQKKSLKKLKKIISALAYLRIFAYCIYTSKETFQAHADLLPIAGVKNLHYGLIYL